MSQQHILIPIGETISSAWKKIKGAKASFFAAFGILFLIALGLGILESMTETISVALEGAIKFVGQVFMYFLQMGLIYMGIQRAADSPISYRLMFRAFTNSKILLNLTLVYFLQLLILIIPIFMMVYAFISIASENTANISTSVGPSGILPFLITSIGQISISTTSFLLLVAGFTLGTFLALRMIMSAGLVLDKNKSGWQAIKLSFRLTRWNVCRLICIYLIQVGIFFLALIPIGIGLIWVLPFHFICYGLIYKKFISSHPTLV
jgi:hypothetical protein